MEDFNKNEQENLEVVENTDKTTEEPKGDPKKLPISIIFSLVGAIVGLIPAIICVAITEYLVGILFALSPLAAFFGFKLGKAPINNLTTIIVIVEALLATALAVFGGYWIIASSVGVNLFEIINEPELGFWGSFFQAELFAGIGIFVSWKTIRNK